uniref:Uncharacterized protein n=1 Tax=Mustela putorius furo TaxID=9669 RepID=M3Y6B3_MUSPF
YWAAPTSLGLLLSWEKGLGLAGWFSILIKAAREAVRIPETSSGRQREGPRPSSTALSGLEPLEGPDVTPAEAVEATSIPACGPSPYSGPPRCLRSPSRRLRQPDAPETARRKAPASRRRPARDCGWGGATADLPRDCGEGRVDLCTLHLPAGVRAHRPQSGQHRFGEPGRGQAGLRAEQSRRSTGSRVGRSGGRSGRDAGGGAT